MQEESEVSKMLDEKNLLIHIDKLEAVIKQLGRDVMECKIKIMELDSLVKQSIMPLLNELNSHTLHS